MLPGSTLNKNTNFDQNLFFQKKNENLNGLFPERVRSAHILRQGQISCTCVATIDNLISSKDSIYRGYKYAHSFPYQKVFLAKLGKITGRHFVLNFSSF